jgi:hypothetical protein
MFVFTSAPSRTGNGFNFADCARHARHESPLTSCTTTRTLGVVAQIIVDAIRPIFDYSGAFAVSLAPHAERVGLRRDMGSPCVAGCSTS